MYSWMNWMKWDKWMRNFEFSYRVRVSFCIGRILSQSQVRDSKIYQVLLRLLHGPEGIGELSPGALTVHWLPSWAWERSARSLTSLSSYAVILSKEGRSESFFVTTASASRATFVAFLAFVWEALTVVLVFPDERSVSSLSAWAAFASFSSAAVSACSCWRNWTSRVSRWVFWSLSSSDCLLISFFLSCAFCSYSCLV